MIQFQFQFQLSPNIGSIFYYVIVTEAIDIRKKLVKLSYSTQRHIQKGNERKYLKTLPHSLIHSFLINSYVLTFTRIYNRLNEGTL